jgi:hypothetical protein
MEKNVLLLVDLKGVVNLHRALVDIDAGCMLIMHVHGPQCKVCNPVMSIAEELPIKGGTNGSCSINFSKV